MTTPVFFLMGPTAAGKTDVALSLCDAFPFEIISVDSSLVYRGLNIGTAKPDPTTLARYPHHLIDIRDPHQSYSAAEFHADAMVRIDEIGARGRIPLLVGGAMFYFATLVQGISPLPAANAELRREIEAEAAQQGWPALHQELARWDPMRAAQLDPNDRQRIQRALEICWLTGATLEQAPNRSGGLDGPVVKLSLAPADRQVLHGRIAQRFQRMLDQGLEEEVHGLLDGADIPADAPLLRMVGYRQVVEYLTGKVSYNDMVSNGVAATRQLAKRQLTWLRNQPGVTWFEGATAGVAQHIRNYVANKFEVIGA